MLNENIKAIRKSKGLSQEELAVKLNVVRQTISKWEQGLSVPDSDMLISKHTVITEKIIPNISNVNMRCLKQRAVQHTMKVTIGRKEVIHNAERKY